MCIPWGCTHLLVRVDLFYKFLHDNYPKEAVDLLLRRLGRATKIIYQADGYAVYRLISSR